MLNKIKQLPDFVANQIAAGEVVNRPASVVKELVENSVDAGSTSVTVNFRNGGKDLIQIMDNGCGMSHVDARLAFDKHATSKINSIDDIYTLSTFGFRGEALASIASVAEVELKSRTADSDVGTQVEINGGKFANQRVVSCPVGTQIAVRNLFYNVPARKRFLEKSTKEASFIISEFQRVALCHTDVGFSLYDNDTLMCELPISSLKQRIIGVVGKSIAGKLLEVKTDTSLVTLSGYVGRPLAAKKNNKEQFMFVNGRYFKSPYFHKAIVSAYEKLIPATEQPSYFIYLEVEPDRIDVNVHPQKIEVKFEDGVAIWQIINAAIRESLAKNGVAPQMDFDMDTSIDIPVFKQQNSVLREPSIRANPEFNPFDKYDGEYSSKTPKSFDLSFDGDSVGGYKSSHKTVEYEQFESTISYEESVLEFIDGDDEPTQAVLELDSEKLLADVLNFGRRYVVTTIDELLVVVDTCRAYEAILYDRYLQVVGEGSGATQQLLFAESICMSIDDYRLLQQCAEDFAQIGFELDFKDEHTVEVRGVPAEFSSIGVQELLYDLLDGMRDDIALPKQQRKERLAAIIARVGALSFNGVADGQNGAIIIEQLMGCSNPSYTPSGLPTMTSFSQQDIKNRLK